MDLLTKPKKVGPEKQLRASLLLAFRKVYKCKPNTDISNSQLRLELGARPRPKRQRGVKLGEAITANNRGTTRSRSLPTGRLWNPFCHSDSSFSA